MTTHITASCACHRFSLTVDFPNASLPLERALCLCASCRRFSGSCGTSYLALPTNTAVDPSKYSLTAYKTSDAITRYFCATCGAHVLGHVSPSGEWKLATGIWDRTEGIVKWTGCKWVEDARDGGVSVWLKGILDPNGKSRDLKRWRLKDGEDGEIVPDAALVALPEQTEPKMQDTLTAQCHCGGVKFFVTRPNEASKKVQSPFPDLTTPFHSHSSENPQNEPWWLRANDTKYMAGTCACPSCRHSLGFEIQTWAFVPNCNIFQEDGTPIDFNMGTLQRYDSSKGALREFCKVCGATVFWHCLWRPDVIDISVGLFDPEQGARVERWLDWWTGRVSFAELAVSKNLVASLEDGMKKWERGTH